MLIIALILQIAGTVVHVIGLATPYWIYWGADLPNVAFFADKHYGIWESCGSDDCIEIKVTQALVVMGMLAACGGIVLAILYTFIGQTSGKKIIGILAMVACFVAGNSIMSPECSSIRAGIHVLRSR
jgi:hypothetical protein